MESIWSKQFAAIEDWAGWLAEGDEPQGVNILRQNADKGLPCGSAEFVQRLGVAAGRQLEYRPQGRPRKIEHEDKGERPLINISFGMDGNGLYISLEMEWISAS